MVSESIKSPEWLAAEMAFGCEFASFTRIAAGKSSRNYCAVAHDGSRYFVKFATPNHVGRVIGLLRSVVSPLVPSLAFNGATGKFGKDAICAIKWSEGGDNIPPHLLTPQLMKAINDGYREFSRALSAVDKLSLPVREGAEDAARECGLELRPIHGDFHYMNYFMRDGNLSACYDLECMRLGLPTEDLLRIFIHAIERTRFWHFMLIRRIFRNLTEMVRLSDYPKDAWLAAVKIYENHKTKRRAEKSSHPLFAKVENWLRAPYYRRLRRAVEEA